VVAWAWRRAPELAVVTAVAALALEWTVRDGVPLLAAVYYALPMPVVASALLLALVLAGLRERHCAVLTCGALLAACIATQRTTAIVTSSPQRVAATRPIRGLLWNAWRARPGLERMIHEIKRHDPDLFVLVEPPVDPLKNPLVRLRELMPEYTFGFLGKRFVIAARGRVGEPADREIDGGSAASVSVTLGGSDLRLDLLCVDVGSSPWRYRRRSLRQIAELAAPIAEGPALVLGDFNTPRRSVHFAPLRGKWTHAFEAAGDGFDATWPEPVPVLAIDHVWGSPELQFMKCTVVSTDLSDHRLVVFDFVP